MRYSSRSHALGIDVGGTAIKAGIVHLASGRLVSRRIQIETPSGARPDAVLDVLKDITARLKWRGPVGLALPAIMKHGVVRTATHIDASWIGVNAPELFTEHLKWQHEVVALNDADAAGIAEVSAGSGKDHQGKILIITLGTGIGTSLFYRGVLIPNMELAHLFLRGKPVDQLASNRIRKKKELSWKRWARGLDEVLDWIEDIAWPDLIIIGGGASSKFPLFEKHLSLRARTVPAAFVNDAGIVGAAFAARRGRGDVPR